MIALAGLQLVVFLGALVTDVTAAAVIAGVFSVVNTLINAITLRAVRNTEAGVRHTHKVLTAPRRAIYDSEGRVIGTVLRLDPDEDWAGRVLGPQRAGDFPDDERRGA